MEKDQFDKNYRDWMNSMDENLPGEVWEGIEDHLDLADIWNQVEPAIPTYNHPLQYLYTFLRVSFVLLLILIIPTDQEIDRNFSNQLVEITFDQNKQSIVDEDGNYDLEMRESIAMEKLQPVVKNGESQQVDQKGAIALPGQDLDSNVSDQIVDITIGQNKHAIVEKDKNYDLEVRESIPLDELQLAEKNEENRIRDQRGTIALANSVVDSLSVNSSEIEDSQVDVKEDTKKLSVPSDLLIGSSELGSTKKSSESLEKERLAIVNTTIDSSLISQQSENKNNEMLLAESDRDRSAELLLEKEESNETLNADRGQLIFIDRFLQAIPYNYLPFGLVTQELNGFDLVEEDIEDQDHKRIRVALDSWGVYTAYNNTWLSNFETREGLKSNSLRNTIPTFDLEFGLQANWKIGRHLLGSRLVFNSRGGQTYYEFLNARFVKREVSLDYIRFEPTYQLPLLDQRLLVFIGPYFSYLLGAKESLGGVESDLMSEIASFDVGFQGGIGIRKNLSPTLHLTSGFRFQRGVSNIFKGNDLIPSTTKVTQNTFYGVFIAIEIKRKKS